MTEIRFTRRSARNTASSARRTTGTNGTSSNYSHLITAPILLRAEDIVKFVDSPMNRISSATDVDEKGGKPEASISANNLRTESDIRRHRRFGTAKDARAKCSV